MKSFIDYIGNKEGLMAIYDGSPPNMHRVFLHSIEVMGAGYQIRLIFDLEEFPKHAPKKWSSHGYNCVQLTVLLLNTVALTIEGFHLECLCNIDVERCENTKNLIIKIHNDSLNMRAMVQVINIEKIGAYIQGEQVP